MSNLPEKYPASSPIQPQLSSAKAIQVGQASLLMAERFNVAAEDFSTVSIDTDSGNRLFVAHAAPLGIDLGERNRSWNQIFADAHNDHFLLELSGQVQDVRSGMTQALYIALRHQRRAAGQQFDSKPHDHSEDAHGRSWVHRWGNTILTGKQPTATDHYFGTEDGKGELKISGCSRTTNSPVLLFRPVLEIT